MPRLRTEGFVRIGDRMRISVELIRQLANDPDFTSPLVVLTEVRLAEDGTKILVLQKVQEPEG